MGHRAKEPLCWETLQSFGFSRLEGLGNRVISIIISSVLIVLIILSTRVWGLQAAMLMFGGFCALRLDSCSRLQR